MQSPTPDTREYHVREMRIALDRTNASHCMPVIDGCKRVLDLGCGAGQTLIALENACTMVGVDIDMPALRLGNEWTRKVSFAAACGEALPFRTGSFDMVISRVAVPYMRLPDAFDEIGRVLMPGGRIWLTLHPLRHAVRKLERGSLKERVFATYCLLNGVALHIIGRTFAFPNGKCESVQTEGGVRSALHRAGFVDVAFEHGRHMIVTATRR